MGGGWGEVVGFFFFSCVFFKMIEMFYHFLAVISHWESAPTDGEQERQQTPTCMAVLHTLFKWRLAVPTRFFSICYVKKLGLKFTGSQLSKLRAQSERTRSLSLSSALL